MKRTFTNNFDTIAPVYDRLSRLVFGRAQMNAQIDQLKYIPVGSRILIVGGGTGWILESIAKQYSSGLQIVYVDVSGKMIRLAGTRNTGSNHVEFIQAAIEDYQADVKFDVVMTPFLFCNFLEDTAASVFDKLHSLLKQDGVWLIADFTLDKGRGKWWKQLLTRSMYLFFKTFGMVEGNTLTDFSLLFKRHDYTLKAARFYYGNFILSAVYIKP